MAYSFSFVARMYKPLIIIQARLSSTRLPGKVLKPFVGSQTILDIQLETVNRYLPEHHVVVATTVNPVDDNIEAHCASKNIDVFRGSEDDVLQRFIDCAQEFGAGAIVRICSDNPFLMGDALVDIANANQDVDYFSFMNNKGVPAIRTHLGLFTEFVKTDALERAATETEEAFYHEHVTNFIYGNPKMFNIQLNSAPSAVAARADLRFTIDTQSDFKTCQEIYAAWDKQSLNSLVALVDENESWLNAMKRGIAQFTK